MRCIADRRVWDRAVLSLPAPHVLQSYDWGAVKARWGWRPSRFVWTEGTRALAAAQVLTRRVAGLPLTVGYVPKGPLVTDIADERLWSQVLADLESWARREGLLLLKIDPDVPSAARAVTGLWARRGWRPSNEQIQFPNTMLSDLRGGEEALLVGMKPKTRYNLRLARRRGVSVRHGGADDLDAFYKLYVETAQRDGFALRTRAYYMDVWSTFLAADRATVILAEHQGRPLAGVVPVQFGPKTWFLYGASASVGRRHMPAYAAQWASLQWALERGCTTYDWWGGPTRPSRDDPLAGVYRFKRGFGAQLVEQAGAHDYPVRAALYNAYALLGGVRRRLLRLRGPGRPRLARTS